MPRLPGWLFLVLFSSSLFAEEIVVASYNVENYLPMDRRVSGRTQRNAAKPESEIAAVVRVLQQIHPDILGLVEMGDESTLADLKRAAAADHVLSGSEPRTEEGDQFARRDRYSDGRERRCV